MATVMKFGGTSVESIEAIERLVSIVKLTEARHQIVENKIRRQPIVVVSAMGKTTNKLLSIAQLAIDGKRQDFLDQIRDLREFHLQIGNHFAAVDKKDILEKFIDEHFSELTELIKGISVIGEMSPRATDAVSSYGERLSSFIVTEAFNSMNQPAMHIDSRDVIITDNRHSQAVPNFIETYRLLQERVVPLTEKTVVVMGGFIGSCNGVTTTLGRGGSDFTASIVGAGIDANEIQIWTDVDGMLTSDPTILSEVYRVKTISFAEAAELAYFGAKVLHPSTVIPAVEKNIPVLILNSRRPEVRGTRIIANAVPCRNAVKSIACKKRITAVNIESTRMLMAHGFLRRIFEVFDRYHTPVDMVTTSEVSVSLTIDTTAHLESIKKELMEFAQVSTDSDQAIICLVGDNIRHTKGITARVFKALNEVDVRMISLGASLLNLSVVVSDADLRNAVELLHKEFFSDLDSEVFE